MGELNALNTLREERDALARAIPNVEKLLQRHREKLAALDRAISELEPIYERPPDDLAVMAAEESSPGITDAVRMVFRSNREFLGPTAIRDALKKDGLIKGYDNEMAVIHQVIRRLEDQGQIVPHPTEKAHRWKPTPPKGTFAARLAENLMTVRSASLPEPGEFGKKK
jgi:hypothetical protein